MAVLDVNDTKLECVEQGTGEPLLLVHGSASDYRTWQAQLSEFGKRYRTIAYSRRYHWPNARIPDGADYSMHEHVDDLQAVLRALDAGPVHLVAHSYGAFVALLLAAREQALIRTLVLAEPPAITLFVSNSPKPRELLKLLFSRPRTAASIMKFGATGVAPATAAARRGDMSAATRIFARAVLGRDYFERLAPSRLEQAYANAVPGEFLGSGFPPVDDERVRSIRTPTLLINGSASPHFLHGVIDRLEELMPNTTRVEIRNASHIVHEDNTPDYNTAVLSFLERTAGGGIGGSHDG